MKVAGIVKVATSRASWRRVVWSEANTTGVSEGDHLLHRGALAEEATSFSRSYSSSSRGVFNQLAECLWRSGSPCDSCLYSSDKLFPFILILGFIVVSVSHRWTIIPLNSRKWFFWVSKEGNNPLDGSALHTSDDSDPAFMEEQCSLSGGLGTILMLILAVNSVTCGFDAVFIEI